MHFKRAVIFDSYYYYYYYLELFIIVFAIYLWRQIENRVILMQLVSHYLQRPSKNRLPSEKNIILFYDICFAIQAVCTIVHIVRTIDACKQTFKHNIIISEPFILQDFLQYKLKGCSVTMTHNMYAFQNVQVTLKSEDILPVLADLVIEMRLGMFIAGLASILGLLNRGFVENNVFAIVSIRNVVIWKDVVSAMELAFLAYILQIAAATETPRAVLQTMFSTCGIERKVTIPFVDAISLYVCASVGFLTYVVSLVLYLIHTLPKYGVLNEVEIEEYKERLRRSKIVTSETRRQVEEAKEAHARLQFQLMETNFAMQQSSKQKDDEIVL